jgi:uncharacterized protein YlxW (UPF0749 family)
MSLLTDLFRTAADDEYAEAARHRTERVGSEQPASSSVWRTPRVRAAVLLTIGVAVLGLLFATTAIQARRSAPAAAAERASLVERIELIRERAEGLRAALATAETTLADAQDNALTTTAEGEALRVELDRLALISGASAVTGPGLVVTLDDAAVERDDTNLDDTRVQDIDLRQVLNGLWSAGAEAVSIDGTRVTSRTSIRAAGDALFADLAPLRPPYEIRAIGNPETLGPRFLDSAGARWLEVLAATYGIRFDVSTSASVEIPAVATLELTWASSATGIDQ